MDYSSLTKKELIEKVEHLERLTTELLKEQQQQNKLEYAWTGNLGQWYWNVKADEVIFNPLKITTLGYDESEIPEKVPYEFFTTKLHPDDYEGVMNNMLNHLYGKTPVYEVEYRILAKDGTYKWYYDRGKITQFDEQEKPVFLAGIVFDISEKKENEHKILEKNEWLAKISAVDELTKIGNSRTLKEHLTNEIILADERDNPLSLAILDIDNFKQVNDTEGHLFGNQVLIDIAKILKDNVRETDMVGRFGGEEFMIIFPNTKLVDAVKISERIRVAVSNHHFNKGYHVTLSGGVAQYKNELINELIDTADTNLYQAKENGKDQISY